MTESESVALPFGDSPMFYFVFAVPQREIHYSAAFYKLQVLFLFFLIFFNLPNRTFLYATRAAKATEKFLLFPVPFIPKSDQNMVY